jgi:hypothetical protein
MAVSFFGGKSCVQKASQHSMHPIGGSWDPMYAPHFDLVKDIPITNFYPVGHYVHNPGGVPTAMITAWYIAGEIIVQVE